MPDQPTIYVVDDDAAVRESMSQLIRTTEMEVECFESADAFLDGFAPDVEGCVIIDVRMPGMNGVELQRTMVEKGIALPVIIVTGHGDIPLCVQAMRYGAVDFLEKPFRPDQLLQAIRQAIAVDQKRRDFSIQSSELRAKFSELTKQEQAVLEGIVAGKPNKTIAAELDISLRTVQFRRASLMKKLNVNSRAQLVRLVTSTTAPGNGQAQSQPI